MSHIHLCGGFVNATITEGFFYGDRAIALVVASEHWSSSQIKIRSQVWLKGKAVIRIAFQVSSPTCPWAPSSEKSQNETRKIPEKL